MADQPSAPRTPHPSGNEEPTDSFGPRTPGSDSGERLSGEGGHPGEARRRGPTSVGPYRILETLGEGGMGVVYLALQVEPIRREVAVKVIRAAQASDQALRRFEIERSTLARMSHPYIAQVYEAGQTVAGEPYIAMEHVPGEPLVAYCDRRKLGLEARLELFCQVCEGVQHAHEKGVLHRDLKPGNVLVREETGRSIPKIIDFGIAKVVDQASELGLTGDRVIGTPAYLSPEAFANPLDVDTRSDVYSLGVMLYELLIGVLPFVGEGGGFLRTMKRKLEEDPPAARVTLAHLDAATRESNAAARGLTAAALTKRLRGDLEWIVDKAVARDRDRRYGSPRDLAEDIQRWRRREVVSAGPPTVRYRLGKFVRRHTAASVGAALFLIAVVGGFVARTVEAERANREAERANREAAEARRTSEEATQLARFLVGLFDKPEQAEGDRPLTVRELLEQGRHRARVELEGEPLTQARLLEAVGVVYRKMGMYEDAEALLDEVLAARERELGPEHVDTANALANVVTLYWLTGRFVEAEPLAERALRIRERELGLDHPDVVQSVEAMALIYRRLGKLELAEPLLLRALPSLERSVGPNHPELANALNAIGIHYWNKGRFEQAADFLRRALTLWERSRGADHPEVAATLNNLAGVARDRGRFAEAEPLYQRALDIRRRALGDQHPAVGYSLANIAQLRRKQGRLAEAEALYRQALDLWERALGPSHPEVAFALNNLALTLLADGRAEEGEPLSRRAMQILRSTVGAEHHSVGSSMNIQALLSHALGRDEEAESLHRAALGLYERVRPADHPSLAWPLQGLANLYRDTGRLAEAGPLYDRALAIRRAALGPDHPDTQELEADAARWFESTQGNGAATREPETP